MNWPISSKGIMITFLFLFVLLTPVLSLTPTDTEKDQHVYSGAKWEGLRTQRFAPHRPHRERYESGILWKQSGMVFSLMLCFFEVFAPQIAEHDLLVNFDDLFCLFAENTFFFLAVTSSQDTFSWPCFPFTSDIPKKISKMVYICFGTAWCQSTLLWLCAFYLFQSGKSS